MNALWKNIVWRQFGAAIDTLENAILACPDDLWADRSKRHEFWYMAYHTLFWLDFYLSETAEDFAPPAPFSGTWPRKMPCDDWGPDRGEGRPAIQIRIGRPHFRRFAFV